MVEKGQKKGQIRTWVEKNAQQRPFPALAALTLFAAQLAVDTVYDLVYDGARGRFDLVRHGSGGNLGERSRTKGGKRSRDGSPAR